MQNDALKQICEVIMIKVLVMILKKRLRASLLTYFSTIKQQTDEKSSTDLIITGFNLSASNVATWHRVPCLDRLKVPNCRRLAFFKERQYECLILLQMVPPSLWGGAFYRKL